MSTTTYIVRKPNTDEVLADRTSPTMHYTHAVLVTTKDEGYGVYSWHTSRELARKAADSLAGNKNVGTAATGDKYSVVEVEAHEGGKAKVLKALAAAKASNDRVKAKAAPIKEARKATTKATTKAKAVASGVAAQDRKAAKAAEPKVKAAPAPATSSAPEGHPGHTWLALLGEAGLSQTQAANAMQVAPMTLNRLINGKGIPTANVTIRFAGVVGKPVKPLWDEVAAWELREAMAAHEAAKASA